MKATHLTLFAAVSLCVFSTVSVEASTWTIPGVANAFGANNTHFVSDLAITNPGNGSTIATVTFLATELPAIDVPLGPGQTVAYRTLLDQLWNVTSSGAVQVSSDS